MVKLQRMNMEELKKNTKIQANASNSAVQKYCLRDRSNKKDEQKQSVQAKTTLTIARNNVLSTLATKCWNDVKKQSKSMCALPKVGQVVLAKMRSYRPWPAIVLNDKKKTVFWVRFFGKQSEGSVKKNECVLFRDAIGCVAEYSKCPLDDYNRAVREAEAMLGIPIEASLLN